ncbi:MAG: cobyrinate a,c-diamide synthase [Butyrivibrio sp.]|nr:cobyrinate a,c-diamide synthase [Butyrivibrio sp.]
MDNKTLPRLLVAAPSSGSGKTLVTCGLLEILMRRGMPPRAYKCGPDYIDPMFHRQVQGIESGNLDSFFADGEELRRILRAQQEPCAILEGVMGIYDGLSVTTGRASCYEIAALTDTPILLIVDAAGAGRTVISLMKGILADDGQQLIRGILLNRISEGFYAQLRPVLERELAESGFPGVRLLGGIPRVPGCSFESRHLGLKLPEEIDGIREKIRSFADVMEETCETEAILAMMAEAGASCLPAGAPEEMDTDPVRPVSSSVESLGHKPVIAVARDEGFCFYYRENLELLEQAGAEIRFFSPIHDRALPEGTAGLLLGGGYPELHLEELSRNTAMLDAIRLAIHAGMPSIAECGGFMYLHRVVRDRTGRSYPLVGAVDGECFDTGHLVRFGYLQIMPDHARHPSAFGQDLTGLKGHEFHYYDTSAPGEDCLVEKPASKKSWRCMICDDTRMWGFPHFYYGSGPDWLTGFIHRAMEAAYGKQ